MKMRIVPNKRFTINLEYCAQWYNKFKYTEFIIYRDDCAIGKMGVGTISEWMNQQIITRGCQYKLITIISLMEAYQFIGRLEFTDITSAELYDMGATLIILREIFDAYNPSNQ